MLSTQTGVHAVAFRRNAETAAYPVAFRRNRLSGDPRLLFFYIIITIFKMCDCDANIFNKSNTEQIYDCDSLGSGQPIYAGSVTSGNTTTFNFKSLIPGSNVSFVTTGNDITISSTDTGITSLSNVGGGAAIGQSITGNTINLRTITSSNANTIITQNTNTVNIRDDNYNFLPAGAGQTLISAVGGYGTGLVTVLLKTLVGGNNISISSDADTITFNSTVVPTDTVTNLGTGSRVLVDVLAGSVRGRTLVGLGGTQINENGNSIDINTLVPLSTGTGTAVYSGVSGNNYNFRSISSALGNLVSANVTDLTINSADVYTLPLNVQYNYMCQTDFTFGGNYLSLSPIAAATLNPVSLNKGNVITVTSTTGRYNPGFRVTEPTLVTGNIVTTNATFATLTINLYPNLTAAYDFANDYLLGAEATTGQLYQINSTAGTENIMKNYDGTNVAAFGAITATSMNIQDNLFYYVLASANTTIRYYDFTNKTQGTIVNISTVNGWTAGAVISGMSYSENNSCLYVSGDLNNSRIAVIPIKPYNRNLGLGNIVFGTISTYANPLTLGLGGTIYDIAVDEQNQSLFITAIPTLGNGTVYQQNMIGSGSTTNQVSITPNPIAAQYSMTFAASGRLYIHDNTTRILRRINQGLSLGNGFSNVFTTTRQYSCHTRTPYGIIA